MNVEAILANYDFSQVQVLKSIAPLLLAGLIVGAISLAVGIYTFLQMRKMQKKNRPKPNQIDGTIADEGVSFCDIAGSPHIHPNITDLWNKKSEAIKQKSGGFLGIGKSSQVTGYRYYTSFAAFIGNRIEKFIAINFDNRGWIVHDPTKHPFNMLPVNKPSIFGQDAGGVVGNIDLEFGYPQPQQNLAYKQHFDLVSAYPYQSYLVFRGNTPDQPFYFGNSNYMKEMLLWVKRIHVKNDGGGQWYEVRSDGAIVCEIGSSLFQSNVDQSLEIPVRTPYTVNQFNSWDGVTYHEAAFSQGAWIGLSAGRFAQAFWGSISTGDLSDVHQAVVSASLTFGGLDGICSVEGEVTINAKTADIATEGLIDVIWNNGDPIRLEGLNTFTASASIPGKKSIRVTMSGPIPSVSGNIFGGGVLLALKNPRGRGIEETSGIDINPIHKIREILTDDTAMGNPESDINDKNFMKAADRIWDEGLGISWVIDEKSCIEAIEELCYHIEAGIRVNRQTGLYEMVLFRDDWFAEEEIHTIAENKIKDLSLEVMNSDDIVNQLNVTYYDRERIKNSTFSVYENGSILTMGHANAESVEFPYFMNMRNAEIVANWKLKQFSTPAWSGSFATGWREARKWNRYDLIRLPWSKKWNGSILVRIMKINLGNGTDNTVTIDFEEVIPYSGEMNTSIVVDDSMNERVQPPQPSINTVFEVPYYLTVLRTGQTNADLELANNPDIGYIAAIAAKPQSNSLNALLYTDGGVGEFEQVSRLDYCDILQLDQPISETASSFIVTGSLIQTTNSSNLILLNGELMGFVSFDAETKVLTVKRGVLDTIPEKHSSGSLFVFDLPDVAFDSTQYAQSEIVEAQVLTTTPSGIQELSEIGQAIEIQSRAIRPYPPANVKINGAFKPSYIEGGLLITWSDRNRLQQTGGEILGYFEGSVTLEPNTQTLLTVIEYDQDNTVLATHSANVTAANTFALEETSMQSSVRVLYINLKTVRDGYECINAFEHALHISNLIPPQNVNFEVIEL